LNLEHILHQVKLGELEPLEAANQINQLSSVSGRVSDLGFAQLDVDREERTGFPEVIYGESKSAEQIAAIITEMRKFNDRVIATRVDAVKATQVMSSIPDLTYHAEARILLWLKTPPNITDSSYIAVVCAGTSDVPVAEEAVIIAQCMNCRVERVYDVGVAGIHRLFAVIRGADAVIVVAGMEGALASVLGGLVSKPVIAVPTSCGYGGNFQGMSALLSMLNACSPGIVVVNIDNGFGAGYFAGMLISNQRKTE
jgi:NCAIR mutase (PurE)-related protein